MALKGNYNNSKFNSSTKQPFTEKEKSVMDLIVNANSEFFELEIMHPDDTKKWIDAIHECQNILMTRVVTRDYPDVFNGAKINK